MDDESSHRLSTVLSRALQEPARRRAVTLAIALVADLVDGIDPVAYDVVTYPEGEGSTTFQVGVILDLGYLSISGTLDRLNSDLDKATASLTPWHQIQDYRLVVEAQDRFRKRVSLTIAGQTLAAEARPRPERLLTFARLTHDKLR